MIATVAPQCTPAVGIFTVGLFRDAPGKKLFRTDRRIWNSKKNARTHDTNIDRFGLPE
jgi:hypothetical protein